MLYPVPFEAAHFWQMDLQGAQQWMGPHADREHMRALENEWAGTLMEDGAPIAAAGAVLYWENRAYAWSIISKRVTAANFLAVHTYAKRFLAGLPFRRLEAAVDVGFEAGHRWVRALGFEIEAPRMRAFQVDGADCVGYVRLKL